jgi:hypothetical protein
MFQLAQRDGIGTGTAENWWIVRRVTQGIVFVGRRSFRGRLSFAGGEIHTGCIVGRNRVVRAVLAKFRRYG